MGRIRLRYYWPVAQPAEAEMGWVRVSTPYSGDGKGQLFTPEVGSQVLVGYEQGGPEFPVVLGNLFHPKNPQGAKYTYPQNNLKGMQTAGGNKVVMSEVAGAQTILISNSNNKGTAVEVSFKGDGSITIKSNGPVSVLSPTITLEAGDKGTIDLHAKTISLKAEQEVTIEATSKVDITTQTLQAQTTNFTAEASGNLTAKGTRAQLTGAADVDISAPLVKINS